MNDKFVNSESDPDINPNEVHNGFECLCKNGFSPVGIYLLKVNNRNTRTRCEICSKLTIKTPE